jgi:hypothetical protein
MMILSRDRFPGDRNEWWPPSLHRCLVPDRTGLSYPELPRDPCWAARASQQKERQAWTQVRPGRDSYDARAAGLEAIGYQPPAVQPPRSRPSYGTWGARGEDFEALKRSPHGARFSSPGRSVFARFRLTGAPSESSDLPETPRPSRSRSRILLPSVRHPPAAPHP